MPEYLEKTKKRKFHQSQKTNLKKKGAKLKVPQHSDEAVKCAKIAIQCEIQWYQVFTAEVNNHFSCALIWYLRGDQGEHTSEANRCFPVVIFSVPSTPYIFT